MLSIQRAGPGEVKVEITGEMGMVAWEPGANQSVVVWLDSSRALELAEGLKDIVQEMDGVERED